MYEPICILIITAYQITVAYLDPVSRNSSLCRGWALGSRRTSTLLMTSLAVRYQPISCISLPIQGINQLAQAMRAVLPNLTPDRTQCSSLLTETWQCCAMSHCVSCWKLETSWLGNLGSSKHRNWRGPYSRLLRTI